MNIEIKEEEIFDNKNKEISQRYDLRRNESSQSFAMQLQNCLENITKLMQQYDPKNEYTTNTLIEYIKSLNVDINNDNYNNYNDDIKQDVLYRNALEIISTKDNELKELQIKYYQMSQQFEQYKLRYSQRIDGTNDDINIDKNNDHHTTYDKNNYQHIITTQQTDILLRTKPLININTNTSIDYDCNDNDEEIDESYYSDSDDYQLMNSHITFNDNVEPIKFINYHNYIRYNKSYDNNDGLNGVQTDWNSSDDNNDYYDETEERQEENDEFSDLIEQWRYLKMRYQNLENDYKSLEMNYKNKCRECNKLKEKISKIKDK